MRRVVTRYPATDKNRADLEMSPADMSVRVQKVREAYEKDATKGKEEGGGGRSDPQARHCFWIRQPRPPKREKLMTEARRKGSVVSAAERREARQLFPNETLEVFLPHNHSLVSRELLCMRVCESSIVSPREGESSGFFFTTRRR